jgi:hypothetical protein
MNPGSLQNLHDIVVPAPSPWLPLAPGWYALGFTLLLLLLWFSGKRYRIWQRNRYRREALYALSCIEKSLTDPAQFPQFLPQLPQLVKRTAIAAYGRIQVASLSGIDWLAFLDNTGATDIFSTGPGKILLECSYQSDSRLKTIPRQQVDGLVKAVYHWISKHQTKR